VSRDTRGWVLAIDQGTTSSRAIAFDADGRISTIARREFPQLYPGSGRVEHDPEAIWDSTLAVCREVLERQGSAPTALGIANQRETTVLWDRSTGRPLGNAIVWQDRRTAARCAALREQGMEDEVVGRTGLLLDPYFSATKLEWMLDNIEGARARAEAGELAFGTVDTFLLWRATGGVVHATDATNASRTMLFNIHAQAWDEELLRLFRVPPALLPRVCDNLHDYGVTDGGAFPFRVPIGGMAGDQQAASLGQMCLFPGMTKSTYGTGCFALAHTGDRAVRSANRLLTTTALRIGGHATYALEGSIFVAGASVQWLRDALKLVSRAEDTAALAASLPDNGGVYLVPAFVGLGAPHWNPHARGAVVGLQRNSGIAHFARAALESVCYQTRDLLAAMERDSGTRLDTLRVDGGMVANDWMLQFLADVLDLTVERPAVIETTAWGAALLAGVQRGLYEGLPEDTAAAAGRWRCDARFEPRMDDNERQRLLGGWEAAVEAVTGVADRMKPSAPDASG
jgi:glycerol kinase